METAIRPLDPLNLLGRLDTAARASFTLAQRLNATGRNAAEYALYGGLRVDEETSPFEVAAEKDHFKLRHYFPNATSKARRRRSVRKAQAELPSLMLVPPLMMMADMFDVAPRTSSVKTVHELGIDVWVVDFGRPEEEPDGLKRSVSDYVLAVSDAVDLVREVTGRGVVLGGYCQGGMFCYQAAAYRRNEGIDSIVTFGAPIDFRAAPMPIPLSADALSFLAEGLLKAGLFRHISLPKWFNRTATRLLDPIKDVQFRLQYLSQLHDREKILPGEQQRRFLEREGWTAYAGPAFADILRNFIVTSRLLEGGLVVGDRIVALADLELPILTVIGDVDKEGHPLAVRKIREAAPRAELYELMLHAGHFGIVAGSAARKWSWPRVADWIRWRAGKGDLPKAVVPAEKAMPMSGWTPSALAQRVQSATELGTSASRAALKLTSSLAGSLLSSAREYTAHLPLLNRLEALRPDTAVSLGLLLDEAAKRDPDATVLMFGDRVVRQRELKHRVDSVVKGLLSVGVRPGDRVGVLMSSRPSAFSVIAAISRLGAAAVLLRPDGNVLAEAKLGAISVLVSDPEHTPSVPPLQGVKCCVLGGGSDVRKLPAHTIDMEGIDPEKVRAPAWFRPNPTHAADVAFVLFTGTGQNTRARTITNRRWVLSALGTASAAQLRATDTVYSVTPLYHASALLMAVGGAFAAGSRLALASGTDSNTFWEEVRRYGATHVSYTWASLRGIAYGPVHPKEKHHPIRMFMGSGMPANLWKRVSARFAPARVLEFYASTEGEAVLANVAGVKRGAVGRPLPGAAKVRIAAYDATENRLVYGPDGLARECATGEAGLLLARSDLPSLSNGVMRSVFDADDAWQSTGDIFVKSASGDYWFIESAGALLRTANGTVAPSRVANALTKIASVDLAVAYGVDVRRKGNVIVAAVTLLPEAELGRWDLESALGRLPQAHWPQFVRVVREIPLTTWSRPDWHGLQREGLPKRGSGETVWRLSADRTTYELHR